MKFLKFLLVFLIILHVKPIESKADVMNLQDKRQWVVIGVIVIILACLAAVIIFGGGAAFLALKDQFQEQCDYTCGTR